MIIVPVAFTYTVLMTIYSIVWLWRRFVCGIKGVDYGKYH